jgi:hypothetical protein
MDELPEVFPLIQERRQAWSTAIKDKKYDGTVILPVMKRAFSGEDLHMPMLISESTSRDHIIQSYFKNCHTERIDIAFGCEQSS